MEISPRVKKAFKTQIGIESLEWLFTESGLTDYEILQARRIFSKHGKSIKDLGAIIRHGLENISCCPGEVIESAIKCPALTKSEKEFLGARK